MSSKIDKFTKTFCTLINNPQFISIVIMIEEHISKFKDHKMSTNSANVIALSNLLNLHINDIMNYMQQVSESIICDKFQKMIRNLISEKEE